MKERPILFSSPMVKAILAGTKTVTRRVLSPQPEHLQRYEYRNKVIYDGEHRLWCWRGNTYDNLIDFGEHNDDRKRLATLCPYGKPGERLWVREAFSPYSNGSPCSIKDATYAVLADGAQVYRDGEAFPPAPSYTPGAFDGVRFRPSIHMPRWASRITLDVTSVRVERLHEITEEDARAEGVETDIYQMADGTIDESMTIRARDNFAALWRKIDGAESWEANPFVWVISFRRVA